MGKTLLALVAAVVIVICGLESGIRGNIVARIYLRGKEAVWQQLHPDRTLHDVAQHLGVSSEGVIAACPKKALNILALGQSLAANRGGERGGGYPGVYSFYLDHCYLGQDPLPGADGTGGTIWMDLARQLLEENIAPAVVINDIAMGSTTVAEWAKGIESDYLKRALEARRPDLVVVEIGESDLVAGTSKRAYIDSMKAVISVIRLKTSAPILISFSSGFCDRYMTAPDLKNSVRQAQMELISPADRIFPGPDTDRMLPAELRYDGCHPSGTGLKVLSNAWLASIKAVYSANLAH